MLEDKQFDDQIDDLDETNSAEEPTPPLTKNQKYAVGGLAVFAILIIVMWFAQLKSNIYGPFNAPASSSEVATSEEESQAATDAALKTKDTDADGLSDYDELNNYKTSPYLADSDSDGYTDGDEIAKGYDPNCPQGRTCAGTGLDTNTTSQATTTSSQTGLENLQEQNSTLNSLLNVYGATNPSTTGTATSGLTSDQLNALKNIDAASLRQLLLQNGMDKATLDKISDSDLLSSFQETMNAQ